MTPQSLHPAAHVTGKVSRLTALDKPEHCFQPSLLQKSRWVETSTQWRGNLATISNMLNFGEVEKRQWADRLFRATFYSHQIRCNEVPTSSDLHRASGDQFNKNNCGLFSIAAAVHVANGKDPSPLPISEHIKLSPLLWVPDSQEEKMVRLMFLHLETRLQIHLVIICLQRREPRTEWLR